jgi:hypothetical protein
MNQVEMHMWAGMMPRMALPTFLTKILIDALGLLASDEDHMFVMVSMPYLGLDL